MNEPTTKPAGWELVERVAKHMVKSIDYIEHIYEGAPTLDRGPIMRNMKRWRDRLQEAIASKPGASCCDRAYKDGYDAGRMHAGSDTMAAELRDRSTAVIAANATGNERIQLEAINKLLSCADSIADRLATSPTVETTPIPLDAPPPKFNPDPRGAIALLRSYNQWRRGADIPQPHPTDIGLAIDVVIAAAAKPSGEAVELTVCCGREECGGECGNEWRGMEWVRKAGQPPAEAQPVGDGEFGVGIQPNPKARYWQDRAEFWRTQAVALGWREKRDAANGEAPPPSAPVGAAEDMVLDAIERRESSAPVGVEWPLSLLRAGHWREVYVGHRCMRLEVTYDYATWGRLMEQVEAALAQQPAAREAEPKLDAHDPASGELVAQWLFRNDLRELAAVVRAQLDMRAQEPAAVDDARPLSEWHEDLGPVTWWKLPIDEPAWIGSPTDDDWPGYHTHWTPHPACPANAGQQGGRSDD